MNANSLLIRYALGWYEVKGTYTPQQWAPPTWTPLDAPFRRERLLSLGAVQSVNELVRIGGEQLAWAGNPRTEITAAHKPQSEADMPYLAYGVSDYVTVPDIDGAPVQERCIAMTVTEDENGTVSFAPQLKDKVLSDAERWQQNLDKMTAGTLDGNSTVAQPATISATVLGKDCCPPWPDPPPT